MGCHRLFRILPLVQWNPNALPWPSRLFKNPKFGRTSLELVAVTAVSSLLPAWLSSAPSSDFSLNYVAPCLDNDISCEFLWMKVCVRAWVCSLVGWRTRPERLNCPGESLNPGLGLLPQGWRYQGRCRPQLRPSGRFGEELPLSGCRVSRWGVVQAEPPAGSPERANCLFQAPGPPPRRPQTRARCFICCCSRHPRPHPASN